MIAPCACRLRPDYCRTDHFVCFLYIFIFILFYFIFLFFCSFCFFVLYALPVLETFGSISGYTKEWTKINNQIPSKTNKQGNYNSHHHLFTQTKHFYLKTLRQYHALLWLTWFVVVTSIQFCRICSWSVCIRLRCKLKQQQQKKNNQWLWTEPVSYEAIRAKQVFPVVSSYW